MNELTDLLVAQVYDGHAMDHDDVLDVFSAARRVVDSLGDGDSSTVQWKDWGMVKSSLVQSDMNTVQGAKDG
jgi:hypothetical protein